MSFVSQLLALLIIIILTHFKWSDTLSLSDCVTTETFDHSYTNFYRMIRPDQDWTDSVRLEFYVSAERNAHILLCPYEHLSKTDQVYEIALGLGNNSYSVLRRAKEGATKSMALTPYILSPVEMRKFWIVIEKTGIIRVGQNKTAILTWIDPNPTHVRYFSFSTWVRTYGMWAFGCPPENITVIDIKENKTKIELTAKDRLLGDYVRSLDSRVAPLILDSDGQPMSSNVVVYMNIAWVNLNVQTSELSTSGSAVLEWTDDRFIWEPDDYDGIRKISIEGYKSWRPHIALINAAEHKFNKPFATEGTMLIRNYGTIVWATNFNTRSVCNLNFQNWPWDSHTCKIQLSIWAQSVSMQDITITQNNLISEWLVKDEESYTYSSTMDSSEYTYSHFAKTDGYYDSTLELDITLKRKTSFYHNMFFYLFIVVSLLLLLAVCTSPLGPRKTTLNGLCILVLTVLLILTTNSLPEFTQQTPTIVMAYSIMLVSTSVYGAVCVILTVLLRMKHELPPPRYLVAIFDNVLFSYICCLPGAIVQEKELYEKAEENNYNTDANAKSELQRRNVLVQWLKLAAAIDNVFSIFILILTIFLFNSF